MTYNLAFGTVVLFEHLHIGIFWQTVFANRGEISGFPPSTVEIVFDLRRHGGVWGGSFSFSFNFDFDFDFVQLGPSRLLQSDRESVLTNKLWQVSHVAVA